MMKWIKANPRRALTAAAVVMGGAGTVSGIVPLRAIADTLAALAPLFGG
jgi:hypothetical protein